MLCTAASSVILISVFVRPLLYIWLSKLCVWSSKLSLPKHCQTWLDSNRTESKGIVGREKFRWMGGYLHITHQSIMQPSAWLSRCERLFSWRNVLKNIWNNDIPQKFPLLWTFSVHLTNTKVLQHCYGLQNISLNLNLSQEIARTRSQPAVVPPRLHFPHWDNSCCLCMKLANLLCPDLQRPYCFIGQSPVTNIPLFWNQELPPSR